MIDSLVQRLSVGTHPLVARRTKTVAQLKDAVDRRYLLLCFTETQGETELGIELDISACDFSNADFDTGTGTVHVEGDLTLDYVPVRLVADVMLETLHGAGCLRVQGSAP